MIKEFALDLKAARRNAGLTQADCAHLIGRYKSKISALEHGNTMPTIREICTLSLIYRKSFESLFGGLLSEVRAELSANLATLPDDDGNRIGSFNRQNTLAALADKLSNDTQQEHANA